MSHLSSSTNGSRINFAVNNNAPTDAGAESNIDKVASTPGGAEIEFPKGSSVSIIDKEGFFT